MPRKDGTIIGVSKPFRDRIRAAAKQRGTTITDLLEGLLPDGAAPAPAPDTVPAAKDKQGRYKCGDRYCTDEELDQLEAVRSGKLQMVDAGESEPDVDRHLSRLEEAIARRPLRLVDWEAFRVHKAECPECEARFQDHIRAQLPELAAAHGYSAPAAAEAPAEETAEAEAPAPVEAAAEEPADPGEDQEVAGEAEGSGSTEEESLYGKGWIGRLYGDPE